MSVCYGFVIKCAHLLLRLLSNVSHLPFTTNNIQSSVSIYLFHLISHTHYYIYFVYLSFFSCFTFSSNLFFYYGFHYVFCLSLPSSPPYIIIHIFTHFIFFFSLSFHSIFLLSFSYVHRFPLLSNSLPPSPLFLYFLFIFFSHFLSFTSYFLIFLFLYTLYIFLSHVLYPLLFTFSSLFS